MAWVMTFTSSRFDASEEAPNPINPIAGQAVLQWIRQQLAASPYTATEPAPEDWGWYMDVSAGSAMYLVGASGEPEEGVRDTTWTIQVDRHRTLMDKLKGRNKLTATDEWIVWLTQLVRSEPSFSAVTVDCEP